METRARFGAVPRTAIVLVTLALLTALAAGAIVVGSSSAPKLPAPFGVAGNGLIAFISEGDLYVVDPDGSGRRRIASGPEVISGPTWSRDGTRLAYWAGPDDGPADLVVTDIEGSDPVVVATTLGSDYDRIEWSADGAEVMYSEIVPGLGSDACPVIGSACGSRLFIAGVDGSGPSQVGDPDLDARGPTLSPDGTTVAFGGGEGAVEALYVMQWDGSDVKRLETGLPGGEWGFVKQSWSADGQTIATKPGGFGVWIVELDEAGQVESTERLGAGMWPSYSPDGSAVDASDGANRMIWTADGTSEPVRVWGVDAGAAWAPDGTQLVGIRRPDLIVYGRDGETIAELGPTDEVNPSWQRVAP